MVPAVTLLMSRRILKRAKMLEFLGKLSETPDCKALTLYLAPLIPRAEVEKSLKEIPVPQEVFPQLVRLAGSSKTGSVLFYQPGQGHLVLPAFPVMAMPSAGGYSVEPLLLCLQQNYRIGLVLVRLGAYAVGICHGETVISSKVGTGLIHGRHRQGGSSAHRFERHRDKQIEYFLTRVCQHAVEHLRPYEKALDYVVYGGAWTTIQLLQKQCPFLGQFHERTLPPLLDIPDPNQAVLAAAISRIWSGTVVTWKES